MVESQWPLQYLAHTMRWVERGVCILEHQLYAPKLIAAAPLQSRRQWFPVQQHLTTRRGQQSGDDARDG
jgi:hypothetical protein